jgi:hypothetical protein
MSRPRRKRFVQPVPVDVVLPQAGVPQRRRDGLDRADADDLRQPSRALLTMPACLGIAFSTSSTFTTSRNANCRSLSGGA